jgi:tetratricopeptide (TPR) repeat protein
VQKIVFILFLLAITTSVAIQPACNSGKDNSKHVDSLISPYLNDPQIKAITDKIHANPKSAELYAKRSLMFYDMRQAKPAYLDISKAIELDSTNAAYYNQEADIFLQDGYMQGAENALEKLIKMQPNNKDGVAKLAKAYFYKKDYDNSMAQVKHLMEMDRTNFEPYFIMGLIYKETGDTNKAIKSFLQSLQYRQNFYDAYMQLGLITSKRNTNEAPQYFDNAIRIDSTQADSWYAKGKFYQDHKQYELAKANYRHLVHISPFNYNALFNVGFILILQDSLQKAESNFGLAIKVKPSFANAYYYRGLCENELGNKEEAKADLRQCLVLDPKNELAANLLNTMNKN